MLEFTGERVVPGLVDADLFNEHLARYRFAAGFAMSARVLDAGCGTGYGAAEFAGAASVTAMDISAEAVAHARASFGRSGVRFLQGACEALPFADGSFDVVAAFEVIEHLERWQDLLTEARRVLAPGGVLLVSTPNKAFYAESRAAAGPNPFHAHEFEYEEFAAALEEVFPHVRLWMQNHSEAMAFIPQSATLGVFDAAGDAAPEQAHFFLAACSLAPIAETRAFAWMPQSGNVLRERERHIWLLASEVEKKNTWLAQAQETHGRLLREHERALAELKSSNGWAESLNGELAAARNVIADLQSELTATHAGYQAELATRAAEAAARLGWVRDLEAEIARGRTEIERQSGENKALENTVEERTLWAQSLDQELVQARAALQRTHAELQELQQATWVRVGRKLRAVGASGEREE